MGRCRRSSSRAWQAKRNWRRRNCGSAPRSNTARRVSRHVALSSAAPSSPASSPPAQRHACTQKPYKPGQGLAASLHLWTAALRSTWQHEGHRPSSYQEGLYRRKGLAAQEGSAREWHAVEARVTRSRRGHQRGARPGGPPPRAPPGSRPPARCTRAARPPACLRMRAHAEGMRL